MTEMTENNRNMGRGRNAAATDSILNGALTLESTLRAQHDLVIQRRDQILSQTEYYTQPQWRNESRSGDQMLARLFDCLKRFDQTKFRRSKPQMEMHLIWTQACLRQIYGTEYLAKLPSLRSRFGVSMFYSLTAIFATRRFGKTFALAQFIAAFIWSQERTVINVFSLSQRASTAIVEKTLMMLGFMERDQATLAAAVKVKNQETLTIVNPLGMRSTVYSYPCSKIR